MELSQVLSEMLKKEKKLSKEEHADVSAVFVAVLTSEGYLRCIPWTEENTLLDHINLLSNGFLEDVALVELAKDLVELKCQDSKVFEEVYKSIKENTDFVNYDELEETMEEIIKDLELDEHVGTSGDETMIC